MLSNLSSETQKVIGPFLSDILKSHKEDIISIYVIGSAVTKDFHAKYSDINTLIVVKEIKIPFFDFIAALGKRYGKRKIRAPLVITSDYISRSMEVFPIEFLEMKTINRLVYGVDILRDVKIEKADGKTEEHKFENAIIATGSVIATIPSLDIKSERLLNSTTALDLPEIPKSLLVIGGGYIGLELGSVYAALGTKVSVVEMMPGLLPGADRDLVSYLAKRIEKSYEKVMLESKVTELKEVKSGIQVKIQDKEGKTTNETYDYVLMSIGRKPTTEGLGLENTNVKVNERGWIKVDKQMKTDDANIYAIGDIAGEPMLAHKASHEGRTAVEVIHGKKVTFEPLAIPAVVFTDPEIAWAGLTEMQAKEQNIKYEVAKFPWAASGRATTLGRSDGVTKLIIDPDTEGILGVGICGPGAGELIAEGVLAIEMGANATDLKLTIHPHPTLSETLMEAAEVFFGQSSHLHKPKKKL